MLKIWDSGSQTYRDAEFVRRYDAETGAWVDCQSGMAQEEGTWEEVWPDREALYLYRNGDECTDVTGGWTYFNRSVSANITENGFETVRQIPSGKYRKINFVFTCQRTANGHISFYGSNGTDIFPLLGTSESSAEKRVLSFDLGQVNKVSLYLRSNAYTTPSCSGTLQGCMEVYRAYSGASATVRVYEVYLSQ